MEAKERTYTGHKEQRQWLLCVLYMRYLHGRLQQGEMEPLFPASKSPNYQNASLRSDIRQCFSAFIIEA